MTRCVKRSRSLVVFFILMGYFGELLLWQQVLFETVCKQKVLNIWSKPLVWHSFGSLPFAGVTAIKVNRQYVNLVIESRSQKNYRKKVTKYYRNRHYSWHVKQSERGVHKVVTYRNRRDLRWRINIQQQEPDIKRDQKHCSKNTGL